MASSIDSTRRDLVRAVSFGLGAFAVGRAGAAIGQDAPRRETADLIVGPFYPQRKPRDRDLDMTRVQGHGRQAAGQLVRIEGQMFDRRGKTLAHRRFEVWQANAAGRYDHPSDPNIELPLDPDFQGYASISTDRDGRYAVLTVKPGPYRTPRGDMRAPHIHFDIHGAVDRKATQLFFPGEPLNAQDRHLNSVRRQETVIATIASPASDTVLLARWDIVLPTG